jgi:hypothetical protein
MRKREKQSANLLFSVFVLLVYFLPGTFSELFAGMDEPEEFNKGVSVSPSHIKFNADLGQTITKKIKISNYTSKVQKFQVIYNDFDMTGEGQSSFLESGSSKYSLASYLSISPTFLEMEPGTAEEITLLVQIPSDPEYSRAAWGVLLIEQVEEKKVLDPGNQSGSTIAFGITPTYAFGVWLYQNPPFVDNLHVDITNFELKSTSKGYALFLDAENMGEGISFCNAYIELTNINNGEQTIYGGKRYTILPGYQRSFVFDIAGDLSQGKYSAVGVLDYESNDELVAAEIEFTVD